MSNRNHKKLENMKKKLEILNAIQLDLDLFYVASIRKNGTIDLQGNATSESILEVSKIVELTFNKEHNWLNGKNTFLDITLTF